MALESSHPSYVLRSPDWRLMRHVYQGERIVKEQGEIYLPPTAGMLLDGMKSGQLGRGMYEAYKTRALFHEFVSEAVKKLIGLLHQKPCTIELPTLMEPLRERATPGGESLDMLLRRINEEQLVTGRLGLFADMPTEERIDAKALPYIAMYNAETIINWDDNSPAYAADEVSLVVLTEHGWKRTEGNLFQWTEQERYRVLMLQNDVYMQGVFLGKQFVEGNMMVPMLRGARANKIPFVFVNPADIVSEPDKPPLLGLANLALAIYRGEADYRQNLYMQGQDTLVVIGQLIAPDALPGEKDAVRVGAGSRIDVDIGGDAKYIGVSSDGLSEQRSALENDKRAAGERAGEMVAPTGGQRESGEALRTRLAAETATLNQIALSGAGGLQAILRHIAVWSGQDPEKVVVVPNLEFSDFEIIGDELAKLMTARTMGAPISKQSIHAVLVDRGLTKMSFEDEIELIKEEDTDMPPPGTQLEDPDGAPSGNA